MSVHIDFNANMSQEVTEQFLEINKVQVIVQIKIVNDEEIAFVTNRAINEKSNTR